MTTKTEQIAELRSKIEKLNPTAEEINEYGEGSYDRFITDNTWRRRLKVGENLHIHIGLRTDLYLDVEQSKDFIKWLEGRRNKQLT